MWVLKLRRDQPEVSELKDMRGWEGVWPRSLQSPSVILCLQILNGDCTSRPYICMFTVAYF